MAKNAALCTKYEAVLVNSLSTKKQKWKFSFIMLIWIVSIYGT